MRTLRSIVAGLSRRRASPRAPDGEERFRQMMTEAPDILYVQDEEGRLIEVNRAAARLLGYSCEELLRLSVYDIIAALRETDIARLFRYLEHRQHITLELSYRRQDGTTFPAEVRVNRIDLRGRRHALVAAREITERKQAEDTLRSAFEALERRSDELAETVATLNRQILERTSAEQQLRDSRAQLRALSSRLLSIQEEERRRIAREIHDELGQGLTALRLDLGWLGVKLGVGASALQAKLQAMSALLDTLVESVQGIASNLRPSLLDDLGLVAAVEWQVREFEERTGMGCALTIGEVPSDLDTERSITIFRILQEALTNVARHAGARHVEVALLARDDALVLTVRDDGRGILPAEANSTSALGLLGMRERVRHREGTLRIRGRRGQGTVLRVDLPLPARPRHPARTEQWTA